MNPLSDWLVDLRAIADHQQRLRDDAGRRTLLPPETHATAPQALRRGGDAGYGGRRRESKRGRADPPALERHKHDEEAKKRAEMPLP
jgi:hypothetical protein